MTNSPFDDADLATSGTAPVFPTVPPTVSPTVSPGAHAGSEAGDARIGDGRNLDSILRIPVLIQVVLGSATMPVANLMKLGRGAIVPLDHRVGEPVDVTVNGRVVARGEIVVVEEDNSRFGVSLTEIVGPADAGPNG